MRTAQPLRNEAQAIIDRLALLEMLGQFGEARLVGSVALDLIVKLDIDFHLLTDQEDLFATAWVISRTLLEHEEIKEFRLTDYRHEGGLKIGIDRYPGPSGDWSIDIWVTNRRETTAFTFTDRLLRELTAEHRQAILTIKAFFHRQDKLRDGISKAIYLAVLEGGVRTVDEFNHYHTVRR